MVSAPRTHECDDTWGQALLPKKHSLGYSLSASSADRGVCQHSTRDPFIARDPFIVLRYC